jgi:hypothetical protein
MLRIMNSAMMPTEGTYRLRRLTPAEFATYGQLIREGASYRSYVGYPQTAEHLSGLLGVFVPVSRESTLLEDGDTLLICRLPYRVQDPTRKGQPLPEDWEYFVADFAAA